MQSSPTSQLAYPDDLDRLAALPAILKSHSDALVGPWVNFGKGAAQAGWTVNTARYRLVLGKAFAWVDLDVTYTGADLTASSAGGNIAGDPAFLVVTDSLFDAAPDMTFPLHRASLATAFGRFRPGTKDFLVTHALSGQVIATGQTYHAAFPMPLFT